MKRGVNEVSKQPVKLNAKEETPTLVKETSTKKQTPKKETDKKVEVKETTPTVELVAEEVTMKNIPERNVRVRLKKDHSCTIGGTRYHFEQGKHYNVPLSVKNILMQSDMLSPL